MRCASIQANSIKHDEQSEFKNKHTQRAKSNSIKEKENKHFTQLTPQ